MVRLRLVGSCVICVTVLLGCFGSGSSEPILTGDDDDASEAGDDDSATDDDDDSAPAAAGIASLYPLDGAVDVYPRNPVLVEFDGVVEDVEITLVEADSGDEVKGALSALDVLTPAGGPRFTVATFDPHGDDPDVHLARATAFTATVQWAEGSHAWAFDTGDLGAAVEGVEAAVLGGDYEWDMSTARFVHPYWQDALALVGAFSGTYDPALQFTVLDPDTSTAQAFGGRTELDGDLLVQDLCTAAGPPLADRTGTWSNPFFRVGMFDGSYGWLLGIAQGEVFIHGGNLEGCFHDGGESITGGIFRGYVDIAVICPALLPTCEDHWDLVCAGLADFGLECSFCPDDGAPYCLELIAFDIQGRRVDVTGTDPETGESYATLIDVTEEAVSQWYWGDVCP